MSETTVAEKRKWLQENGYTVGSRGKLSAENEQAFASQTPAQDVPVSQATGEPAQA